MVALLIFRSGAQAPALARGGRARASAKAAPTCAPTTRGGDEVSALAHTFNHMAGELEARTAALAPRTARGASCSPTSRTS